MKISVVSEIWLLSMKLVSQPVRGSFSAKVPNSSFAEVCMGLLIEPNHVEDENEDEDQDENQENEKEDERDGEECRVATTTCG